MFITLKLLVLSYSEISGVLPGEGDDYSRRAFLPAFPEQHGSVSHKPSAATLHLPFLCPVVFHLRAAAPAALASPSCDDVLPFPLQRRQSLHALLMFSLQALVTLGMASPLLLLSLWHSCPRFWLKGKVGVGWKLQHFLSSESLLAHRSCGAGRYRINEKQSTRARLFLKQL